MMKRAADVRRLNLGRAIGGEMNRIVLLGLTAILLIPGMPAKAQMSDPTKDSFKAQDLGLACNPPANADETARESADRTCQIYLHGLADGLFLLGAMADTGSQICLPKDGPVSAADAKDEFEDYLKAHPEMAAHSAGLVAAFALVKAHPCPQ
jgi:Rap1a immunity proteins